MGNLKITHLAQHEYDGWWLRFSGDSETWELLKDELKARGRAYARWTPLYEWSDTKTGAWWIDDDLLRVTFAGWFINLDDAMRAARISEDGQYIARRPPASASANRPTAQPARRVPAHLMQEYMLLSVGADATPKNVKDAYRSLSKRYHPDAGGTHDDFISLQKAYEKVTRWLEVTERIAV